jgi:hypothetical protein
MPKHKIGASDEVGRSFSAMFNMARGVPELMEFWRVMAETLTSSRLDENSEEQTDSQQNDAAASNDPVALVVRANALMLSHGTRYWLDWQKLLARHLPAIRRRLEALNDKGAKDQETKAALIDDVRAYLREMAELPARHGRWLQHDIELLETDVFSKAKQKVVRRGHRAKS